MPFGGKLLYTCWFAIAVNMHVRKRSAIVSKVRCTWMHLPTCSIALQEFSLAASFGTVEVCFVRS